MNTINWTNNSSSYNGKMLRAIIAISDNEIVEANLYYTPEYEQKTNDYGVKWNEPTGLYSLVLNSGRMRRSGTAFAGGLGRTTVISKLHKRQTLKALEKVAAELSADGIIAAAGEAKPTLIVGNK